MIDPRTTLSAMAMGKRRLRAKQASMWVATTDLPRSAAHPFYTRLNRILDRADFDSYVESLCQRFYADEIGRPGLPPGRYFRLLLIGYFEGLDAERAIARDAFDAPLVALVNRQFALRHASKPEDILGRKLAIRGEARWRQIVGVVANTKVYSDDAFPPYVYLPHTQDPQRTMFLMVRMPGRLSAKAVNQAIADVDPDVAPYQMRTINEGLRTQTSASLVLFWLFDGLATVSAALAAFGLFGVFSFFVAQRSREFGIRLALGSTAHELGKMILREGWWTMVPGLAIGVAGGAMLSRYAVGAIYGVSTNPYDPVVYAACVVLLGASGTVALSIPARRAKRVRVTDLLRS